MSDNVLEYILRLRDEFSQTARNAASSSQSSLTAIGGGALLVAQNFDVIAQRSGQAFGVLTGHYDQLGSLLGALPGPIGVVGQVIGDSIGGAITDVLTAADAFDKLSRKTGISVEFLSGFTEASDDVRVSSAAVETGLVKFARAMGGLEDPMDGVAAGGKSVTATLKDLNIQAFDATGKMRPMEEVLLDVSDVFAAMPDGPEKAALAVQLFGKSGTDLIPILNRGKVAIGEMMQAAKDTGLVITSDTVVAMDRLRRAQDNIEDSWKGITRQIGSEVIPVIGNLTTGFNQYLTEAGKLNTQTDILTRFTSGADLAFRLFTGALKDTESATKNEKQATEDASAAKANAEAATTRFKEKENELRDSINNVSAAFGGQTEMMSDLEFAHAAIDLAMGKITLRQLEEKEVTEALTKAYKDGEVTLEEVVKTTTEFGKKTISAEEALGKAGKAGEKYAAELAGVKWQAQLAGSESANFKRTLDTIPSSKTTAISATTTGGDAVATLKGNIDGIPSAKTTRVDASTTGKQSVDDLSGSVNNIPSQKTTRVTASTVDANEMYNLWGWVNGIPSQKTTTATAYTYGVYGYNSLQDATDHINALRDMGLNLGVNTTVTVLGYNGNSPMTKKGGPTARASGAPALAPGGGMNFNMPMTVNVRRDQDAFALQSALRSVARAANLRASVGA